MSNTGASDWWAPTARICARITAAICSTNCGFHVLAAPMICGKHVAPIAIYPLQLSS